MTTATERPRKGVARAAAPLIALVAFDALTKAIALLALRAGEPVHDGALFQLVLRVNRTGVGSFGRLLLHGQQIQTMLPAAFGYIALSTAMVVVRQRELRRSLKVAVCASVFFAVFAVGQTLLPHLLHWPAGVALLLLRLSLASLWITVWALVSSRWFKLGLLFFAASATGNLLSLLMPPSAVVDFVYSAPVSHVFGLGVFNVADALFLLGEMLLVLAALHWFLRRMIRLSRGTSAVLVDYPDDADGDALRKVAAEGSDMSKPMAIDFAVAVPDEATAKQVASLVEEHGYAPKVWQDEEDGSWTCYCTRTMVPTYDAVVEAQQQLDELAEPVGGECDGWGTFGNVDSEE